MAFNLATGVYDSSKSIPYSWQYPLATSLALLLIMFPFSSSLFLNTHLVPIMDLSLGLGTNSHTSFLLN